MARTLLLLCLGLVFTGCGREYGPLIDLGAFAATGPEADPFGDERPADVACPETTWGEEDGYFEAETGVCAYLSVSQPTLLTGHPGDVVHLTVWHQDLWAENPATAHVAVIFDGVTLLDETSPVPGPADSWTLDHVLDRRVPAGRPFHLHIHNHGVNNWRLLPAELLAPSE